MAQPTTDHDVIARRLSDDFNQFKTSHHLPDDLESSRIFLEVVVSLLAQLFFSLSVTGAISHLQKQAQEVMRQKPKWPSYFQGQMIAKDDFDFISQYDQLNSEGRAKLLNDPNMKSQVGCSRSPRDHEPNRFLQCAKTFLTLTSKLFKQQTLQYLLTLLDEFLRVRRSRRMYLYNTCLVSCWTGRQKPCGDLQHLCEDEERTVMVVFFQYVLQSRSIRRLSGTMIDSRCAHISFAPDKSHHR